MNDSYEHYISRNIAAFYKKRLASPILYLLILLAAWIILPLGNLLSPSRLDKTISPTALLQKGKPYVKSTFTDLTFTGYSAKDGITTVGYYYYTYLGNDCIIVLLSPNTCDQGAPRIKELTIRGKIQEAGESYNALMGHLASDLNWTADGLRSQMPTHYISEPAFHRGSAILFFLLYFGSLIYALLCLILYLVFIRFPFLSPPCQNLVVFGNPKRILEEAEEELATLPQLATEDMFITEHYFIMTSPYGNALVPIQEILWIYKYSTLHKFLWYHFNISYTLHITANKHLYLHCPKNIKSDIDGIMDYLAEANHNILVGFTEENRRKVELVLGQPFHIERFRAWMHKKV